MSLKAGFFLACALAAALPAAEKLRPELECVLGLAGSSLELRLPSLEDASLRRLALGAARRGAKVRWIASPLRKANRPLAEALKKGGVQLRWDSSERGGLALADESCLLKDGFDGAPDTLDAPSLGRRAMDDALLASALCDEFEGAWNSAWPEIPEGLLLKEELDALPDPRENAPRLRIRRRAL
jgi:hypothetical protein